jgi:magnesium-transporting ATPase (P-type)
MITADHRGTAAAVAREVGPLGQRGVVLDASQLPEDDEELAACLDGEDGAVVARVTPCQNCVLPASYGSADTSSP